MLLLLAVMAAAADTHPYLAGYEKDVGRFSDYSNFPVRPRIVHDMSRADTMNPSESIVYQRRLLPVDAQVPGFIGQRPILPATDSAEDAVMGQHPLMPLLVQQQQPEQPATPSDAAPPADGPAAVEDDQPGARLADQQTSAQESGDSTAQLPTLQEPGFIPYQSPGPFGMSPLFQSSAPVPWGVHPVQRPIYPDFFRDQQRQQEERPDVPAADNTRSAVYPGQLQWIPPMRAEPSPFGYQRQVFSAPQANFGIDNRAGPVQQPFDVPPYPTQNSYVREMAMGLNRVPVAVPSEQEQSTPEENETEKENKEDEAEDHKYEDTDNGDIDDKVKALKDAADVEEEVVPALVVFLRKKGHKAFHDKDSVGIPGKEDRFRRSPGGGSGSSSHSSSSSSSSSGPVYFGDGGSGSYSSSSSQSSASSSSGGGAPLGFGGSAPGLGGGNSFYGNVPASGYGATGSGYGGPTGGYGGSAGGYGVPAGGYGGSAGGYGVPAGGYGGSAGGGYGGGLGPSGSECSSCGGDGNVLLNRFGSSDDGAGGVSLGGSGVSTGKGVHSSASSSIDSTGKVTYSAFAGKH